MENLSGLEPLGRAVLLRMVEIDEIKAKAIVIPEQVRRNSATLEQRGIVVAVGATCWCDEPAPRCKPGDKVIITKMAGFMTKGADGEIYRMVNDKDVFCRITREAETNNG